jgi:hypothetical protein
VINSESIANNYFYICEGKSYILLEPIELIIEKRQLDTYFLTARDFS